MVVKRVLDKCAVHVIHNGTERLYRNLRNIVYQKQWQFSPTYRFPALVKNKSRMYVAHKQVITGVRV